MPKRQAVARRPEPLHRPSSTRRRHDRRTGAGSAPVRRDAPGGITRDPPAPTEIACADPPAPTAMFRAEHRDPRHPRGSRDPHCAVRSCEVPRGTFAIAMCRAAGSRSATALRDISRHLSPTRPPAQTASVTPTPPGASHPWPPRPHLHRPPQHRLPLRRPVELRIPPGKPPRPLGVARLAQHRLQLRPPRPLPRLPAPRRGTVAAQGWNSWSLFHRWILYGGAGRRSI